MSSVVLCDPKVVSAPEGDEWVSLGVAGTLAVVNAVVHARIQTRSVLARKAGEAMLIRKIRWIYNNAVAVGIGEFFTQMRCSLECIVGRGIIVEDRAELLSPAHLSGGCVLGGPI